MTTVTGTSNTTVYLEGSEQVWPCRCGETHRGDYGLFDFLHHECYHGPFWVLEGMAICSECGATWDIAK